MSFLVTQHVGEQGGKLVTLKSGPRLEVGGVGLARISSAEWVTHCTAVGWEASLGKPPYFGGSTGTSAC